MTDVIQATAWKKDVMSFSDLLGTNVKREEWREVRRPVKEALETVLFSQYS